MKESRYFFVIAIIIIILIASGCKDDGGIAANQQIDASKLPTMVSRNVQTLLSDSGQTKYRITTKTWLAYEEQEHPHWVFPDGLIAEELDKQTFNVNMSMKCDSAHYDRNTRMLNLTGNITIHDKNGSEITCDSAYYDEAKALWSLNSMVTITSKDGSKIETNQMFWDRKASKYYSDSFIRMQAQDKILEGYGYVSNEKITTYKVNRVQAIVPVNDTRFPTFN
ncbi:MAG: LPS export ABC transporter periplasmic protein LptC [Muribaculaceae bacterium]|nr:LPS export ABC transporter periplasmic protein LptC [Muribaculaceae bacterium]MBR5118527.1 LPS export ABC transporter periplasmic protein LptC [Muribaculaceae bacterium]